MQKRPTGSTSDSLKEAKKSRVESSDEGRGDNTISVITMAAPSQTSPNQASEATSTVGTVEKDAAPKKQEETSAPPAESETPSNTPAAAPKPQKEAAPSKNSSPEQAKEEEEVTYQNTQTSNVVCSRNANEGSPSTS